MRHRTRERVVGCLAPLAWVGALFGAWALSDRSCATWVSVHRTGRGLRAETQKRAHLSATEGDLYLVTKMISPHLDPTCNSHCWPACCGNVPQAKHLARRAESASSLAWAWIPGTVGNQLTRHEPDCTSKTEDRALDGGYPGWPMTLYSHFKVGTHAGPSPQCRQHNRVIRSRARYNEDLHRFLYPPCAARMLG